MVLYTRQWKILILPAALYLARIGKELVLRSPKRCYGIFSDSAVLFFTQEFLFRSSYRRRSLSTTVIQGTITTTTWPSLLSLLPLMSHSLPSFSSDSSPCGIKPSGSWAGCTPRSIPHTAHSLLRAGPSSLSGLLYTYSSGQQAIGYKMCSFNLTRTLL